MSKKETVQTEVHGQGIRAVVTARRAELELRMAELQNSEQQGSDMEQGIETSLAMLDTLMPPGDISPVVAEQLVRWLESNKHLGVVDEKSLRVVHA